MPESHIEIDPAILYFGTPVVLLSTVDAEGRPNLAPMSSVFWLGQTAVLGMCLRSQPSSNLAAAGEIVINLPSVEQVSAVDRLALTTGRNPVPTAKEQVGYIYSSDKFAHADLTAVPSRTVAPPRIAECPVSLEGRLVATHPLIANDPSETGKASVFEISVTRVHVHPAVQDEAFPNRIDPDRWRPLIMSFQKFFGLTTQIRPSRLSKIDEEWYR
ncbi:flavin reductase family protein [Klugiella xanthotipulae]|uniref:Flavin reductase (DIM6/NTAB) family NADH-FMN oxidoreductase RutF n=1 Tax=Klugiella xanthotipulae TaxID=244735 RepID=A0A543I474_9MICO|nr:flavin reductase family protein [Klugiella xanthotipulae]TQM65341.1 flavin reductase (DIM6/NTAB) family NADH-FMN oxidoreductase RutF [Klugiella xanthotipulae]